MRLSPGVRAAVAETLRSRGLIDVISVAGDALARAVETAALHAHVEALRLIADQLDEGSIATDPAELARDLRYAAEAMLSA